MSYVDSKSKDGSKSTELRCDHSGCKRKTTGKNHTEAWTKAKKEGWLMRSNDEQICPIHREEHSKRGATKPVAKGKKATAKSGKKKTMVATRKPGNVISYTSAPDEG